MLDSHSPTVINRIDCSRHPENILYAMLSKYGQFSRQFKTRGALKIVLRRGRNGARIKSFYSLNHEIEILSQDPKETRNTLHLNGIYISVKHGINIIVPCHRALRKGFISLCAQIKLGTIQVENRFPAKKTLQCKGLISDFLERKKVTIGRCNH